MGQSTLQYSEIGLHSLQPRLHIYISIYVHLLVAIQWRLSIENDWVEQETIQTRPEIAAERRMELVGGEAVFGRWEAATAELAKEKEPRLAEVTEDPCEE